MNLRLYQVDAFAESVFSGNPAAVCPLENWLSEQLMQKIAQENNLSETAYFVKNGDNYEIRWFTPEAEVDLCGHATLASAFVIFNFLEKTADKLVFKYKLGELIVIKKGEVLEMNFPANPPKKASIPANFSRAFGMSPSSFYGRNFGMAVFGSQEAIENLHPDFNALKEIEYHAVIATAPGRDVDFVSRVFAPKIGINEDPVTGAAHTELIPFWSNRLKKSKLIARQISKRGGDLICELNGDRVKIAGKAALYMVGNITI